MSEGVILQPKILGMNAENLLPDGAKPLGNGLFVIEEDQTFAAQNKGSHPCEQYIDLIKQGLFYCEADITLYAVNTPNDPSYGSLWGMQKIKAPQAWDLATGSREVVVGVIDTGIDYNHPDLSANMWRNPNEVAGDGIDNDGNGIIDDVYGYNAITNSGDPMDDNSHGTHCAGTIGGVGNNGVGVAGVSWAVKMIGAKFLSANGSGRLSHAIAAIDYLTNLKTQQGVNIVLTNNSWGGGGYSQFLSDAIQRHRDAGIIFVAAAGNSRNDNDSLPSYPASYDIDNVIAVAATDSDDNLASFSNYGANSVDIAAPGVGILSTIHGNRYASYSGTSMATPHVAGAIALLKSYTNLSMTNLINRIYNTGDPLSQLNGIVRTGKRLNLFAALTNDESDSPEPPSSGENCYYSANKLNSFIGLSPSQITSLPLIEESKDEFYNTVNLNMQFFDEVFNKVHISPNGTVYFTSVAPSNMDYQNNAIANNSISIFHADLISNIHAGLDGLGRQVIAFEAVPYTDRTAEPSYVSLVHTGNGTFVASFQKASGVNFGKILMGLKGDTQESMRIHKNEEIPNINEYSVRYSLTCNNSGGGDGGNSDGDSVISRLKVKYKTRINQLKRNNIRKNASVARIIASYPISTSEVNEDIAVTIGNYTCSDTISFNLGANKDKSTFFSPIFNARVTLSPTGSPLTANIRRNDRRRARRANYLRKNRGIAISNERRCTRYVKLFNRYNSN